MYMEGAGDKIKSIQQFLKSLLKFATIFKNILRKSGRLWSNFGEVWKFLRNKTFGMEESLLKLCNTEIERNLK